MARHRHRRALAGLAGLAHRANVPSRSALKVVGAFVLGKGASGACKVPRTKGAPRECNYQTDGIDLKVKGVTVGEKVPAGITARTIKVCPGAIGGDAESTKAAGALFSVLGTGIGFQHRQGKRFLRGKNRRGIVEAPESCFNVQVAAPIRKAAMLAFKADVAKGKAKSERDPVNKARLELEAARDLAHEKRLIRHEKSRVIKAAIRRLDDRRLVRNARAEGKYLKKLKTRLKRLKSKARKGRKSRK